MYVPKIYVLFSWFEANKYDGVHRQSGTTSNVFFLEPDALILCYRAQSMEAELGSAPSMPAGPEVFSISHIAIGKWARVHVDFHGPF